MKNLVATCNLSNSKRFVIPTAEVTHPRGSRNQSQWERNPPLCHLDRSVPGFRTKSGYAQWRDLQFCRTQATAFFDRAHPISVGAEGRPAKRQPSPEGLGLPFPKPPSAGGAAQVICHPDRSGWDLLFYRIAPAPLVIPTGAYPDFLPCCPQQRPRMRLSAKRGATTPSVTLLLTGNPGGRSGGTCCSTAHFRPQPLRYSEGAPE
jgi:hypothetical protein